MSEGTSIWDDYFEPFLKIAGLLGVLLAGVFSMYTQFRPNPAFTYSLGGMITFWFFGLLGFIVAFILISSLSDSALVLLFIILLYTFCGVMIGYKGVPALLHRYADHHEFETRVITMRKFRSSSRYSFMDGECRYKLVVSENEGDKRVGDHICVTESIYRHALRGDAYQVFGVESKYGWKVIHSSRLRR